MCVGKSEMQDREQIQKEIDAVKLQLSIADMSAITASEDEKEHWDKRRESLQLRLAALEKDLEECVVYDGDNAASILDDAAADAMLQQILSAEETPTEPMQPDAADTMADVLISRILETTEEDLPVEDSALRGKQQFDEAKLSENAEIADTAAEPPIDNILFTAADADISADMDDAAVNAMLNEILQAADQGQPENATSEENTAIEQSPPVAEQAADEQNASMAESATANDDTIVMPMQAPIENDGAGVAQTAREPATVEQEKTTEASAAEEMLQKILNAVKPQAPAPTEQEKIAAETSAPRIEREQATLTQETVASPLREKSAPALDADTAADLERLRREAEEANARAQAALQEAERMRKEAEDIRLQAETERAMYAAEMELQRGLRVREDSMRHAAEQAEKDRLAEKIARRKAEITAIRNELQEIKDSDGAFSLREKLLAVQLVLDDDERANAELSYLLTKSIDDVAHALEVAELKRRIAALVAVKKAPAKPPVHKKKATKKAAPKKKKAVAAPVRHRRPPLRGSARRRPTPRYR